METVIAFIVIFGALVFFHELGHFIFAKRAGILCREFAIGFGPKVFSMKKGETTYTIRLLPLGGFVRMAGEDPEMIDVKRGQVVGLLFHEDGKVKKVIVNHKDEYPDAKIIEVERADFEHELYIEGYEGDDERLQRFELSDPAYIVIDREEVQIAPYDRQFGSKTLGQRAMAIFAGPLMNFILALVIFILIGLLQGYPVDKPVIGELTEDGAARQAGLQQGDVVMSINGQPMSSWTDVVTIIRKSPEKPLQFQVNRNGQIIDLTVTPEKKTIEGETIGLIGVYGPMEKSFVGAIKQGALETYYWTKEIIVGLGHLLTGKFSFDMLSGPVGIAVSTHKVAQSGVYYLMKWGAILSINLGIINLLPLPALDGGRLTFFAIEALRGKPIDRQKEGIVHFIGFALLMLLMLVVTWNDIQKFFL
ncbi:MULTISPECIES: RIP metalloprotease RseP [Anoxybacillus]|uniref:Zinc metalloprotease n=1 Tax=Anoxybacillus ayderensis TaxID=265546 RepID=A0A0D0H3A8_9BACL|nr:MULTISPECIES: RIP metalloprotease RseP [Anoxybacillus]KHF30951.1 Regulator of sigma-W protease RasP [Anoxybacillus sp. BCO1]KIP22581.1 Zinc metalloprotease rasP [Anoxybacillus ayderensis]MBA2878659.1 regulator of sigma E protease [Anoxybacillus ayderensis]MCL6616836.1 RIP metalloprotease RseP [Anoxybacillus ayderensis]MED0687656.1 RIP metalloprotease RseP [Anoxybacillus ayderensis]